MSTRAWLDSKRQYYLTSSRSTPAQTTTTKTPSSSSSQLHIGDKVQVNSLNGTIRFIGSTKFKAGTWAGIELDTIGLGKNDGSVDGKRYFICPPNTGIFILAIKVMKQQHFISLHNRPSTPRNIHNTTASNRPRPPLPITTSTNATTTKKVIISPTTPTLTPIPTPTSTTTIKNNDTNNQLLILQKRVEELEAENKSLRQSNEFLEQTVNDIKSASMDSIEILENMIQSNQNTIIELESNLNTEKLKYNKLEHEQNDIKKAGLEAIELTISELESTNQKSEKLIQENESMAKSHHKEIKILLQDISVLENVLQSKMDNEIYLLNSLKKEKHQNARLSLELSKKFGSKTNAATIADTRWSFIRDTPIQEEEEEDLLDDNILSNCALCEKQGHDLIHCNIIINQQKQHQ